MHFAAGKSIVAFALSALFLAITTEARTSPYVHYILDFTPCKGMKEGHWEILKRFPAGAFPEDRVPPEADPTDLVFAAKFNVDLTEVAPNVFNGTGMADSHLPETRVDPVVISGLFDPKSCVFSGSLANAQGHGAIIFRWYSEGDKMSGPLIVTEDKILTKALVGLCNATLIE